MTIRSIVSGAYISGRSNARIVKPSMTAASLSVSSSMSIDGGRSSAIVRRSRTVLVRWCSSSVSSSFLVCNVELVRGRMANTHQTPVDVRFSVDDC